MQDLLEDADTEEKVKKLFEEEDFIKTMKEKKDQLLKLIKKLLTKKKYR